MLMQLGVCLEGWFFLANREKIIRISTEKKKA